MNEPVSICAIASVSPLGDENATIWENYCKNNHYLSLRNFDKFEAYVGEIPNDVNLNLEKLKNSDSKYKSLDRSVLLAMYTARKALKQVAWNDEFGVNIGSSRGATELFEKYYDDFLTDSKGKTATLTSPTTTLGNIASWVAHDLQTNGPVISHSITCSTALHSLLNGIAWIRSGMSKTFLVGGSEAANTDFTVAQMRALKIYADSDPNQKYPCKALDFNKEKNTMALGEGAVSICLERGIQKNALAIIKGIGYATEKLKHNISISSDAECFQKSMKMALKDANVATVDAIVMHAPGTVKGDSSEFIAIQKIFGEQLPMLTSNKWKIGHTLGTSGMLSLELAILMFQNQKFISVPYLKEEPKNTPLQTILVNAVGFGGNAVSILIARN